MSVSFAFLVIGAALVGVVLGVPAGAIAFVVKQRRTRR